MNFITALANVKPQPAVVADERKAANRAKLRPFYYRRGGASVSDDARTKRAVERDFRRTSCSVGGCKRWSNSYHKHLCFEHSERWFLEPQFALIGVPFKVIDKPDMPVLSPSGLMFRITLDCSLFKPFLDVSSLQQRERLLAWMTHDELCRYVLLCLNAGHARRPGAFYTESRDIASLYEAGFFSLNSSRDWLVIDTCSDAEMCYLVDAMADLPDVNFGDEWWQRPLREAIARARRVYVDAIEGAVVRSRKAEIAHEAKKRKCE